MGRFRSTPALIISIIALVVALGGTAYAVKKIGASGIKNNAIKTKKIKNKAVKTDKLDDEAVTKEKVDGALSVGFASVGATGTLLQAQGVVASVSRAGPGVYCFDLTEPVAGGVVSLEASGSGAGARVAGSTIANPPCAVPFNDFRVHTRNDNLVSTNNAFYVALF